ncbi:MAG: hypothetical protein ABIN01_13565 [Ferruginibacter sp.]
MARLIDISDVGAMPSQIKVQKGDLLSFNASGGHVNAAPNVVEMLGPFTTGILIGTGEIIMPAGPPGIVMFYAKLVGKAQIDVVTGDSFTNPVTTFFEVQVL